MKRLSLKLFCIFFIAIFCLTPLSAIDSSQNNGIANNHQSIDDNRTSETKIANETTNTTINGNDKNIVDHITEKDAKDDEITSADKTIKDSKISENNTESDKLDLIDPQLEVDVKDIKVGQKTELVVHMNSSISDKLIYYIYCTDESQGRETFAGNINVENGFGRLTVPKEFPSGDYIVGVYYYGSKEKGISSADVEKGFNVEKWNPDLNVYAANFTADEKHFVAIKTNSDINENVDLIIENPYKEYSVKLENGESVFKLDNLTTGRHTATVKYHGNNKYNAAEKNVEFFVTGTVNSKLKININDTIVGQSPVAEIYGDESFNGRVMVGDLPGHTGEMPYVENGYCKYEFAEWNDLAPGNYTVTLNYFGDETFKPFKKTTRFEVKEKN